MEQDKHGIADYIDKVNEQYRTEFDTSSDIIDMSGDDATVTVDNSNIPDTIVGVVESGGLTGADSTVEEARIFDYGKKVFAVGSTGGVVQRWDLSNRYDLSTATKNATEKSITATPNGFCFSTDGTVMWITDTDGDIEEHELSTAWDLSTAAFMRSKSLGGSVATSIFVGPRGDNIVTLDTSAGYIDWYTTATTGTIADGITYKSSLNLGNLGVPDPSQVFGVSVSPFGGKLAFTDRVYQRVLFCNLGTNWDVSTATYNTQMSVSQVGSSVLSVHQANDGNKVFAYDSGSNEMIGFEKQLRF